MSHTTAYISFNVTGSVQQEIMILDPDLTAEELVRQLEDGELFTTLDVSDPDMGGDARVIFKFDENEKEVVVGKILSQTTVGGHHGGVEMSQFELDEEISDDEADGDETTG